MKIRNLQETKNFVFSQPTRQTGLMIFVLFCVFIIAYLLFPAVAPIFLSSPYLNGVIIGVFVLGVLACFWQVFILVSSVYWIEGFVSERPGHEIAKPPRILAPLESLLRDKQSRRNINPLSARSILDSVATRLDEVRDITTAGLSFNLEIPPPPKPNNYDRYILWEKRTNNEIPRKK